jgi:hypothetical protein
MAEESKSKKWEVGDWIRIKPGAPHAAGLMVQVKELDLDGTALKVGETDDRRLWFWTDSRWIEAL